MTYEIRAAFKTGKALTMKQRTSSHFDWAPRIGVTVLRPGAVLKLSEEQYAHHTLAINRLLSAEAIIVTKEGEKVPEHSEEAPSPVPPASQLSTDLSTEETKDMAEASSKTTEEYVKDSPNWGAAGTTLPPPEETDKAPPPEPYHSKAVEPAPDETETEDTRSKKKTGKGKH